MRSKKEITNLVTTARERIYASCKELVEKRNIDFTGSIAEVEKDINGIIESVCNVVSGESFYIEGADLPKFLKSWTYLEDEGKILYIDLKARTKLNSEVLFKAEDRIYCDENFINNVANLVASTVLEIFYINLALENVKDINSLLGKVIAEAGINLPFDIEFVLSNSAVTNISDDEIHLGVSPERATDIASLAVFIGGDNYLDYCASIAKGKFTDALVTVQTPVQLLKANIELITDLTGLKTKKRADSILRTVFHKQAKFLKDSKAGLGYIAEEVEIAGEKVEIFALVSKEANELEVVLSPFNVKTLENVDFDVLSLLVEPVAEEVKKEDVKETAEATV